jgi:alpha-beta hydrolase superfamily lysophospholipase
MSLNSVNTSSPELQYFPDILGNGFLQTTIKQPDDYEGKVVCTLVKKSCETKTDKAVLYVHGFNDYFFQEEMAEQFIKHGFNFYAIDLRKYGRSWLPNQKITNARDLAEYDADIETVLNIIQREGNQKVLLNGHSTGGLIVALFAHTHPGSRLFDAVFLNSPFFNMNIGIFARVFGLPFIAWIGKKRPDRLMKEDPSSIYGSSLHQSVYGEWDYNTVWKKIVAPTVNAGWVRAIHRAHVQAMKGFVIDKPTLVLYSDNSLYGKIWDRKFLEGDAVLNVKHIARRARKIKGDCTVKHVVKALHDVFLSPKPVREEAYGSMFQWLDTKMK